MEIEKKFTYRNYLHHEFSLRARRNPSYSLRAFARDIGLYPSKLSEILRFQCGISETAAAKVAQKLSLSEFETRHFITLVEVEHARSEIKKKLAKEKLNNFEKLNGFKILDLERFKIVSDWYHNAILELTDVAEFRSSHAWIAQALNLPEEKVDQAIDRLIDFGLLKKEDGVYKQTQADLATPTGISSKYIRSYHHQILQKACTALEENNLFERDYSAITFSVAEDQVSFAKERIKDFRRKLVKELQAKSPKQRVYNLSIQLFPLDKKEIEI